MERIKHRRPSPGTIMGAAAMALAAAALAVAVSGSATATTAEVSKVGKLKVFTKQGVAPDGGVDSAKARCRRKLKPISGGFVSADQRAVVSESRPYLGRSWRVSVFNPPGFGGNEAFLAYVVCAK